MVTAAAKKTAVPSDTHATADKPATAAAAVKKGHYRQPIENPVTIGMSSNTLLHKQQQQQKQQQKQSKQMSQSKSTLQPAYQNTTNTANNANYEVDDVIRSPLQQKQVWMRNWLANLKSKGEI